MIELVRTLLDQILPLALLAELQTFLARLRGCLKYKLAEVQLGLSRVCVGPVGQLLQLSAIEQLALADAKFTLLHDLTTGP